MGEFTGNEKFEELPIVSDHINVDMVNVSEKPIKTAREAIDFVAEKIYDRSEEVAVAIFYDDNLVPLYVATPDRGGTPHNRKFFPEDIKQTARLHNASYVTLLHSYPELSTEGEKRSLSGDNIAITKSIADACNMVGVKIYDFIVVLSLSQGQYAESVYYSFLEMFFKNS